MDSKHANCKTQRRMAKRTPKPVHQTSAANLAECFKSQVPFAERTSDGRPAIDPETQARLGAEI